MQLHACTNALLYQERMHQDASYLYIQLPGGSLSLPVPCWCSSSRSRRCKRTGPVHGWCRSSSPGSVKLGPSVRLCHSSHPLSSLLASSTVVDYSGATCRFQFNCRTSISRTRTGECTIARATIRQALTSPVVAASWWHTVLSWPWHYFAAITWLLTTRATRATSAPRSLLGLNRHPLSYQGLASPIVMSEDPPRARRALAAG
ncbi:hypothetical protein GGI43DRAFT_8210 [Trichoderma evansii]